ncbi:MAG: TonB-dependent receptor plug domain-containing protein, partial [Chitinophagaceae bacterium]
MKQKLLKGIGKAFPMLLITLLLSVAGYAQKTVTGRVTGGKPVQPIVGATVTVTGTAVSTMTNSEGNFSIAVPEGRKALVISFVGYASQDVDISNASNINVSMLDATGSLGEVVVTGYTSQRKKDIIGAVSVVDIENMKMAPAANVGAQLQGRATGVTVSQNGAPGSPAIVRIRGFQSGGNNEPLYIIDGVPTSDASNLNPQDISSLQVLKDGTASAIYGTRAANGVVIISTKQGKAGRTEVTYDGYL